MLERLTELLSAIALVALALTACEPPVRQSANSALGERQEPVQVVAVTPFAVAPRLRDQPQRFGDSSPEAASRLLVAKVTETLSRRGVRVVPANDVRLALEASGGDMRPPQVSRIVAEKFGADALLTGQLTRWAEREGTAASATRGATVGFEVVLFDAPGGQRLWSGSFDQTQLPLSENLLQALRLPGGGTRWLTAEELAHWGAEQTAQQMPLN